MRTQTSSTPVTELLDTSASTFGDRVALVHGDERITWSELHDRVERLAGALSARGVRPGDPVALPLANVPEFAVAFLAVLRVGAVVVPLNPHFKEAELEFHFAECGVRAVIAEPEVIGVCRSVAARLMERPELFVTRGEAAGAEALEGLIEAGGTPVEHAPGPDDDADFQYSSGSTGRPKRVPRSHGHLRAEADAYVAAIGLTAEDTMFCTIPLFHTYGMGCCLLAAVRSGATLVLFHDPNPFVLQRGRALELLAREGATVFPAVPFTFRLLSEAPEDADLSALRLCFSAAAALPRATFNAFRERFGIPIRQLYGCTEAGAVTVNLDEDPYETSGSCGRAIEGVQLRVVDEAGDELEHGRIGEILIRSSAMTPGYGGERRAQRGGLPRRLVSIGGSRPHRRAGSAVHHRRGASC